MHAPSLALRHVPTTAVARRRESRSIAILGLAALCTISMFLVGMPMLGMGVLTILAAALATIGVRAELRETAVTPVVQFESIEARETYRGIERAQEELERTIAETPDLSPTALPMLEQCLAAVKLSGSMATLHNQLQHYLDTHDPALIRCELERLRSRAEAVGDPRAVAALSRAAAARSRQLATRDEIVGMRDRIQAQLELVQAALESFTARIVGLAACDEEDPGRGETVTDHLDGASEEIEAAVSALVELAA